MPRVKINDLKPDAKELNMQEMKNLFGGAVAAPITTTAISVCGGGCAPGAGISLKMDSAMTKQEYPGMMKGENTGIIK
ncbi:MAG: hypothetical protein ACM3PP_02055 [Candidatus Saccharibacteria bacterium]